MEGGKGAEAAEGSGDQGQGAEVGGVAEIEAGRGTGPESRAEFQLEQPSAEAVEELREVSTVQSGQRELRTRGSEAGAGNSGAGKIGGEAAVPEEPEQGYKGWSRAAELQAGQLEFQGLEQRCHRLSGAAEVRGEGELRAEVNKGLTQYSVQRGRKGSNLYNYAATALVHNLEGCPETALSEVSGLAAQLSQFKGRHLPESRQYRCLESESVASLSDKLKLPLSELLKFNTLRFKQLEAYSMLRKDMELALPPFDVQYCYAQLGSLPDWKAWAMPKEPDDLDSVVVVIQTEDGQRFSSIKLVEAWCKSQRRPLNTGQMSELESEVARVTQTVKEQQCARREDRFFPRPSLWGGNRNSNGEASVGTTTRRTLLNSAARKPIGETGSRDPTIVATDDKHRAVDPSCSLVGSFVEIMGTHDKEGGSGYVEEISKELGKAKLTLFSVPKMGQYDPDENITWCQIKQLRQLSKTEMAVLVGRWCNCILEELRAGDFDFEGKASLESSLKGVQKHVFESEYDVTALLVSLMHTKNEVLSLSKRNLVQRFPSSHILAEGKGSVSSVSSRKSGRNPIERYEYSVKTLLSWYIVGKNGPQSSTRKCQELCARQKALAAQASRQVQDDEEMLSRATREYERTNQELQQKLSFQEELESLKAESQQRKEQLLLCAMERQEKEDELNIRKKAVLEKRLSNAKYIALSNLKDAMQQQMASVQPALARHSDVHENTIPQTNAAISNPEESAHSQLSTGKGMHKPKSSTRLYSEKLEQFHQNQARPDDFEVDKLAQPVSDTESSDQIEEGGELSQTPLDIRGDHVKKSRKRKSSSDGNRSPTQRIHDAPADRIGTAVLKMQQEVWDGEEDISESPAKSAASGMWMPNFTDPVEQTKPPAVRDSFDYQTTSPEKKVREKRRVTLQVEKISEGPVPGDPKPPLKKRTFSQDDRNRKIDSSTDPLQQERSDTTPHLKSSVSSATQRTKVKSTSPVKAGNLVEIHSMKMANFNGRRGLVKMVFDDKNLRIKLIDGRMVQVKSRYAKVLHPADFSDNQAYINFQREVIDAALRKPQVLPTDLSHLSEEQTGSVTAVPEDSRKELSKGEPCDSSRQRSTSPRVEIESMDSSDCLSQRETQEMEDDQLAPGNLDPPGKATPHDLPPSQTENLELPAEGTEGEVVDLTVESLELKLSTTKNQSAEETSLDSTVVRAVAHRQQQETLCDRLKALQDQWLGVKIWKEFFDTEDISLGLFEGRVIEVHLKEVHEAAEDLFTVLYTDGDEEDLNLEEIQQFSKL